MGKHQHSIEKIISVADKMDEMRENMKKVFRKQRVSSLLFQINSLVVFGVLSVSISLTLLGTHLFEKVYVKTFIESQSKVLTQVEKSFSALNQEIISIMNSVNNSWAIRLYLSKENMVPSMESATIYEMRQKMKSVLTGGNFNAGSILIVGLNGKTYLNTENSLIMSGDEILKNQITKNALRSGNSILYQYSKSGFTESTQYDRVIIATKVLRKQKSGEVYGIVYIIIKEEVFEKYYDYFVNIASDVFITNADNLVISSNKKEYISKSIAESTGISNIQNRNNDLTVKTMKHNGHKKTILANHLQFYNFTIYGVFDNDKVLLDTYNHHMGRVYVICSTITVIIILLVSLVIKQATKPLYKLTKNMSKVREGNFDQYISVKGTSEIADLASTYNYMLDGLNTYVKQLMVVENEKRKAEIHSLQMQINPHYVYNTLTIIKWLIWQKDREKAVQVIDAFIHLLQSSIYNSKEFVTVKEEMEGLKNYVLINNVRYGDNIKVSYYVMENCNNCLIPKLIIQPIIENAFFHGFSGLEKGEINVYIVSTGQELVCEISDNGVGMSEEQINDIINSTKKKNENFSGIGIKNVDDRIKLLYGDEFGITITSLKNSGTTVKIRIPAIKPG